MNRYTKGIVLSLGIHVFALFVGCVVWYLSLRHNERIVPVDFLSIQSAYSGVSGKEEGGVSKGIAAKTSAMKEKNRTPFISSKPVATQHSASVIAHTVEASVSENSADVLSKKEKLPFTRQGRIANASSNSSGKTASSPSEDSGSRMGKGNNSAGKGDGTGIGYGTENGDAAKKEVQQYVAQQYRYILQQIKRHLIYPEKARRMGITGKAIYTFIIQKDGKITSLHLKNSSGNQTLDEAAQKAITYASPFPVPPHPAKLVIPVIFSLR